MPRAPKSKAAVLSAPTPLDSPQTFEFDVALSFHSLDEGLATQLSDLLQDRFRTLLYSKRQESLAGSDGEESFSAVFAKKARAVVIFYRKEWGETPFTRIEKTAIKNRAFDSGYEFTLFVPTEESPGRLPDWLPKTQLYYSLQRFGMDGLAATIEYRVRQLGAGPRVESIADTAARVQRTLRLKEAQDEFRRGDGPGGALRAYENLVRALEDGLVEMAQAGPAFAFPAPKRHHNSWLVAGGPNLALAVIWKRKWANDLQGTALEIRIYKGHPPWPGTWTLGEAAQVASMTFDFGLEALDRSGYTERYGKSKRYYSEQHLAAHILQFYMQTVANQRN